MVDTAAAHFAMRVLVRAATARDALMAEDVLARARIATTRCDDMAQVISAISDGAGALLIAEETFVDDGISELVQALTGQPPWSDLPVLVLARTGANSRAVDDAMDLPANVTVLERPMRVASLISTVRSALRARKRQYELRKVVDGLSEADRRKTEFLATLAHELRNPMAPLSTTLAVLQHSTPPPDEAAQMYQLMSRQVDHMVRLVNDLMEVSRVTRAQIELQLEDVALDDVLHDALALSQPLLDGAGHHLDVQLAGPGATVRGDRVRLAQVFSNLLNNAAKYTRDGGNIAVTSTVRNRSVVVHVIDDGIGIPPDMLDAVFGMFVQVDAGTATSKSGLGIGLTLVRSLVEQHGGEVVVRSEGDGCGTDVAVTLPLLQAAPKHLPHMSGEHAVPRVTGTVLVVDDNRDAADSMAAVLRLLGASVGVAYDGVEGLERAAELRPTAAIIDIGMPRMDGCDLARHLRADPAHEGIALVALTGWGQSGDRERVAAAGFDAHLLKPADIGTLVATLRELADRG